MAPLRPKYARRGVAYRTTTFSSPSPSSPYPTKATTKLQPSSHRLRLRRVAGFKKSCRRSPTQPSNVPSLLTLPLELRFSISDQLMNVPCTIIISATSRRQPLLGPLSSMSQTSKHIDTEMRSYLGKWFGCGGTLPAHIYRSRVFGLINLNCTTFIIDWRGRQYQKLIRRHLPKHVTIELLRTLEVRQEVIWDVGSFQGSINLAILKLWSEEEIEGEGKAFALDDHGGKRCGEYLLYPMNGDEGWKKKWKG